MTRNAKLYNFLTIVIMVLLCYYTFKSILALGFIGETGSFAAVVALSVSVVSLFTILISKGKKSTQFSRFWWVWIIWFLVDFFVLGLRGIGLANIWFVIFAPMTFLFFFTASDYSDKVKKIATIGFLVLYGIAYYMNFRYLSFVQVDITEEIGITNLVYWCLCAVPFIFLIPKKWIRLVLILLTVVVVLLTGKRSANICMVFILVSLVLFNGKKERRTRNVIFALLGGVVLLVFVNRYLSFAVEGVVERMYTVQKSQGSGRVPLYNDVFNVLKTNSVVDWLVGRGYGSILITNHTNAHNDALQMLFEYGIVGLILYVIMFVSVIKRTIKLYRHNSQFFMGYLVSVIIFVVLGMVSNLVVFYSYFAFLCAYWGLAENEIQYNRVHGLQIDNLWKK